MAYVMIITIIADVNLIMAVLNGCAAYVLWWRNDDALYNVLMSALNSVTYAALAGGGPNGPG